MGRAGHVASRTEDLGPVNEASEVHTHGGLTIIPKSYIMYLPIVV